jgi:hypothetical protein
MGRKFVVQVNLAKSTSRGSWFIKAVYRIGEKAGKEGKMENGAGDGDGDGSRGGVGVSGAVLRLEG